MSVEYHGMIADMQAEIDRLLAQVEKRGELLRDCTRAINSTGLTREGRLKLNARIRAELGESGWNVNPAGKPGNA